MKVCNVFELKSPLPEQMYKIVLLSMPSLNTSIISNMIDYLQGDLRKLTSIATIYKKHQKILNIEILQNIFKPKSYNEDTKEITQKYFTYLFDKQKYNIMNDKR